jgi:hypothetical protein
MKIKKSFEGKAGIGRTMLKVGAVLGIIVGLIWASAGPYPQVVNDDKGWHILFDGNLAQAAEGNPGAGASGILEIFFINHSATNAYKYVNTSATLESWCTTAGLGYASADDFNVELAHSVLFDICIKVRVNKTHAWDGSKFIDSWVRMNITSADLGIGALTAMEKYVYYNNTGQTYIWLCFFYDFSNAGYDLSKDESADITAIRLEAYY